jgi:epoxide hydrolase 4
MSPLFAYLVSAVTARACGKPASSSTRLHIPRTRDTRRPISAPTLVIWGEGDSYLGSDLAEPNRDDVPNLDRVERLPDAWHWVHHDEAERVNQLLIDFFARVA